MFHYIQHWPQKRIWFFSPYFVLNENKYLDLFSHFLWLSWCTKLSPWSHFAAPHSSLSLLTCGCSVFRPPPFFLIYLPTYTGNKSKSAHIPHMAIKIHCNVNSPAVSALHWQVLTCRPACKHPHTSTHTCKDTKLPTHRLCKQLTWRSMNDQRGRCLFTLRLPSPSICVTLLSHGFCHFL